MFLSIKDGHQCYFPSMTTESRVHVSHVSFLALIVSALVPYNFYKMGIYFHMALTFSFLTT